MLQTKNSSNHFGSLEQEELRKLTFAIVPSLLLENTPIPSCLCPLHDFPSLFRFQVWSAGRGNIEKLEILLLLPFETAKHNLRLNTGIDPTSDWWR